MSRIGGWVSLLAPNLASVGSAESIRPVFLQVPSIDTGTSLLLLYGKHWNLFKQEGLDLKIVVARPNIATATLISGDAQFSAQFQSCYYSGTRGVPSGVLWSLTPERHFVVPPEVKKSFRRDRDLRCGFLFSADGSIRWIDLVTRQFVVYC